MTDEHHVGQQISEYWHVLTGITLALFWAGVRVKNRLRDPYATTSQMNQCRADVVDMFKVHERKEFEKHDEYRKENLEAHQRISDKVDDLKDTIIDIVRDK